MKILKDHKVRRNTVKIFGKKKKKLYKRFLVKIIEKIYGVNKP